ncbi:hypothetical protein CoNPh36_CDS0004 [Staphylococcus phage S-CoN_Ph36]|nr:hypothetical protein CoNPh36_CDS0004 [Staphylococcus phage S-CoN_Ph36]
MFINYFSSLMILHLNVFIFNEQKYVHVYYIIN